MTGSTAVLYNVQRCCACDECPAAGTMPGKCLERLERSGLVGPMLSLGLIFIAGSVFAQSAAWLK
ncbi:hypothetical protein [Herbaspirillum lusitanum]|uniref:hypothetical protein n=1 Tax=Herbaspirillum lusitanum TaxID=213312 RepID=UPI00223764B0|nr:hypothetical protein [Herbaspirillum lusitanum]